MSRQTAGTDARARAQPVLWHLERDARGGAIEDNHLGGHAQETLEVGFEIQRQVTEGRRRRLREQHPDVDIAR